MTTESQDTSKKSAYALPEAARQNILKRLFQELKGNVSDNTKLEYKDYKGAIYKVEAKTHFELQGDFIRETLKGKQNKGHLLSSIEELSVKSGEITSGHHNTDIIHHVRNTILSQPEKGFAQSKSLGIKSLSESYCVHLACNTCHAQGSVSCKSCQGRGQAICHACRGKRATACPACRSSGFVQTPQGRNTCPRCQGRGTSACNTCRGSGQTQCRKCGSKGKQSCPTCSASGWTTEVGTATVAARLSFTIAGDIPPDFEKSIERDGAKFYKSENLQLKILQPSENASLRELQNISYVFTCPHGHLDLSLGQSELSLALTGSKALVTDCSPFLSKILQKEKSYLRIASSSKGLPVIHNLKKASRKRAMRETILVASRYSLEKATHALSKRYPLGMNKKTHLENISLAKKALKNLTRATRYKAVLIGILVAMALQTFYNFTGLRTSLTTPPNLITEILCDIGIFLLGFILNLVSVEMIGRKSQRKTLFKIIGQAPKGRLEFNRGHTTLFSFLGNIVAVVIIWLTAIYAFNSPLPSWLGF